MSMFCFQCEQTAKETGCTSFGVCGKDPDTAALQDLLIHQAKQVSVLAHKDRLNGKANPSADRFVIEALFTTVTNVNFDAEDLIGRIRSGDSILREMAADAVPSVETGRNGIDYSAPMDELLRQAERISLEKRFDMQGRDVTGLQELILYGLKGMAAYADHAMILGVEDNDVNAFFHEALAFLANNPTEVSELTTMALRVGQINLRVMEMLHEGNTGSYGAQEPTSVRVTPVKGKCILVSGHDLKDLDELLKQTEGKGINIYTHGEMLPCHAYPGLKKHKHLVGNYGGAWQDQRREFDQFPGAILMTTNCIQKPRESYSDRIFTCGLVRWPGVTNIENRNFTPVIESALSQPGFEVDAEPKHIMVGFGQEAVLSVADKVIEAVREKKIRHFFLVGGCDGAKSGRNYYTDLAQQIPDDCVILTLACGKYRFNKLDFGDIGGIPRLLDVGQCNDAYSAVKIASALANAFECEVNDLPLSMILSWYEQKAVCILLTLLSLGIKKIKLGPSLPAFVGPSVLKVLVDNFELAPVGNPSDDIRQALGETIAAANS